jgi:hypothetical protein
MMQKSTAFTTIFRVEKCHFHCDMQKKIIETRTHYLWSVDHRI